MTPTAQLKDALERANDDAAWQLSVAQTLQKSHPSHAHEMAVNACNERLVILADAEDVLKQLDGWDEDDTE